jgi:hypothetical protein
MRLRRTAWGGASSVGPPRSRRTPSVRVTRRYGGGCFRQQPPAPATELAQRPIKLVYRVTPLRLAHLGIGIHCNQELGAIEPKATVWSAGDGVLAIGLPGEEQQLPVVELQQRIVLDLERQNALGSIGRGG